MQVTEWDEPQAVIGSYLHKYAYPDWYAAAPEARQEAAARRRARRRRRAAACSCAANICTSPKGADGMRVYDVASIANKGVSEKIDHRAVSARSARTRISRSTNATCVALPTNQPINPARNAGD